MDRLTDRMSDGSVRIKGTKTLYGSEERSGAKLHNAIVRLEKYEDTGLSPEEIEGLERREYRNGQADI